MRGELMMDDEEFEVNIQNTLRSLSREQLEQIALAMVRHLKRERRAEELMNLGIGSEDLKRSG
jgi:hypothetical protein